VKIFQSNFFDTKCKKITFKVLTRTSRKRKRFFITKARKDENTKKVKLKFRAFPISCFRDWFYFLPLKTTNFRPRNLLLKNDAQPLNDKRLHENWTLHSSFRCQVSGVSSKKARASLKPDTRHLKPMLRKGFT